MEKDKGQLPVLRRSSSFRYRVRIQKKKKYVKLFFKYAKVSSKKIQSSIVERRSIENGYLKKDYVWFHHHSRKWTRLIIQSFACVGVLLKGLYKYLRVWSLHHSKNQDSFKLLFKIKSFNLNESLRRITWLRE